MLQLQCRSSGCCSINTGAVEASVAILEPLKLQLQCWSRWSFSCNAVTVDIIYSYNFIAGAVDATVHLQCWNSGCNVANIKAVDDIVEKLELCYSINAWANDILQLQCRSSVCHNINAGEQWIQQLKCWRAVDTTVDMLESSGYNSWNAGEQWIQQLKCRRCLC